MGRLTERDEYGNADIIGVDSAELMSCLEFEEFNLVSDTLNRLAAYEDTGKTPEEIEQLKSRFDNAFELPCKVGDIVYNKTMSKYMIIENYSLNVTKDLSKIYFHCRCVEHDKSNRKGERAINVCPRCAFGDKCFQGFYMFDFGETVFLTREDAEKALSERLLKNEM